MIGLIIGFKGETIKMLNQRTGAYIYVPKLVPSDLGNTERLKTIEVSGDSEEIIDNAIDEI